MISSDFYAVTSPPGRKPAAWSTFTAGRTSEGISCGPATRAAPAPREAAAAAARLEEAGAAWDEAISVIDEARKKQMTAPGLQEPAKKALATLDREWDGRPPTATIR